MKNKQIKNVEVIDYKGCWENFKVLLQGLVLLSPEPEKLKTIETAMDNLEKKNTTFEVEQ